ncbi:MAG: hypothetical protein KDB63_00300 [Nocardioidaceae bacterium]|nr:hypothetical protein [Nocardioidaceae bacterium]
MSVAACGGRPAPTTHNAADVHVSARSSQIRSDAAALFFSWYGTDRDRAAAEIIVAHELNGAAGECMTLEGYPLDWTEAIQNAAPVDPLGPSIWTNEPMGRIFSAPYLAGADFLRAEQEMNAGDSDAGRAEASNACRKQAPAVGDKEIDAIRHPRGQEKLMSAWRDGLRAATSEFGTYDDYQTCIDTQDVPRVGDEPVTAENFYWRLRRYAPTAADMPSHKSPHGSSTWQEFLDLESQWLSADWACRADTYEAAMSRVPAFLDEFATEHADQIAGLQASWHDTRRKAAKLI